ncbi:hypothetical protein D2A34_05225 [Clostridium chromiireducens]|uniref:Uncharacterized protein n=1 Tax=Clostridium chromiireducens TaxID=225345 RepID=A0A399IUI0_9CLOT|nr:hypothetical protein [Clostridium chromiireducens]RII36785.1 hypothetical protein D2A34_05225 [Clostridium chromiireducens]
MQTLKIGIQKKKQIYPLLGYEKAPVGGSKKTFERKLSECVKWNTDGCKTTEINIVEIYKQPNDTTFEHGLKGNTNGCGNKGKLYWNNNSNSKFVGAVLLNKIEYFENNDKIKNQFVTIKTLSERCGFKTNDTETANSLSIEIKRNIAKLEKLGVVKVERKYNAKVGKAFIEIAEDEYLKFKEVSKKVWKNLNEPVVESFHTFYQFINLVGDTDNNQYIKSLYYEVLAKETDIWFVFETYKLSVITNENNAEIITELTDMLLDEDITIQEKINNYVEDKEDYFLEKRISMQEENKYTPSGFGKGFLWYTKTLATANNAVVF